MRFIAAIVIVAIIVVGVLIGLGIQRLKTRQGEELQFQRDEKDLALAQLKVAKEELRTIRDIRGESSLNATLALEEIDRLRDEHYTKTKGEIAR